VDIPDALATVRDLLYAWQIAIPFELFLGPFFEYAHGVFLHFCTQSYNRSI
jgi:hypothetical protein